MHSPSLVMTETCHPLYLGYNRGPRRRGDYMTRPALFQPVYPRVKPFSYLDPFYLFREVHYLFFSLRPGIIGTFVHRSLLTQDCGYVFLRQARGIFIPLYFPVSGHNAIRRLTGPPYIELCIPGYLQDTVLKSEVVSMVKEMYVNLYCCCCCFGWTGCLSVIAILAVYFE
ncbi:hypothetical protein F4810DRAFT_46597 [Camillea tinctor]|nr:hypothetical protein F4810DRAFT_46597 [Camillea tinctor]